MQKSGSKVSKHSTLSKQSSKSSYGENSINSTLLKENLQDFFKNTKEKLLRLKGEIDELEIENKRQQEENKLLQIRNSELLEYNGELNLRVKGMKEKILIAQKNKLNLSNQIKDIRKNTYNLTKDIDSMKINNQYKVKIIQNDIDHCSVVKENNTKSIRSKIQNEQTYQDSLLEKIGEIKEEIVRYKDIISHVNEQDKNRNKEIVKETAEMTKFLSEL